MDFFFKPSSVAIVGASPVLTKAGGVIFQNFVHNKQHDLFTGELYPVNPTYESVFDFKCYPSVSSIGKPVDCIVVVVPANAVCSVLEDSVREGVKGAVIITSGFSEIGNHDLEAKVLEIAKKGNMRIIGPNCLGVYDAWSGVDTLFLPENKILSTGREVVATPRPVRGPIVLISQSGALGAAALDYMAGRAMGVRALVSLGNRADVAEDELLRYFRNDEWTRVILLYIEGIRNGRAFLEAASSVSLVKPIVAIKVGRSSSGARAAASHTAAMSGQDEVYESAFELSGIVRARNLDEFFDMGRAFLYQPPAKGNRVAILTNAGGPGVMAADTLEESGLSVVELSGETKSKLERLKAEGKILPYASIRNPVDLSGTATSQMFETALRVLVDDDEIDAVLVITLHHTPAVLDDVVGKVIHACYDRRKPVIACDIGSTEMAEEIRSRFEKLRVPAYTTPERAARALYALVTYGKYLEHAKKHGLL